MLDTDGNPTPLVGNWHEAGVDCIQPYEVNSVDMLKLADEYPDYVMMGGIYKHYSESLERYGKANRVTRTTI